MTDQFIVRNNVAQSGAHAAGTLQTFYASNTESPEQQCRKALTTLLRPGETLPMTKRISLYHIRCLVNGTIGGEPTHGVNFVPEFLYVLDIGFEHFAGVSIDSPRQMHGDPYFPNFSKPSFRSIASEDPIHLLYPIVAGRLIVSFDEKIGGDEAEELLSPYVHEVSGEEGFFEVVCDPFREEQLASTIREEVAEVRSVQPNQIIRPVDLNPGWYVDQVL